MRCVIQETLVTWYIYGYLRMRTQPRLKNTLFCEYIFILKDQSIQTKMISVPGSTFQIKAMLSRTLFSILPTLAVRVCFTDNFVSPTYSQKYLKLWPCYIIRQWDWFTRMLLYMYIFFLGIFLLFFIKKVVFLIISLFWWNIAFPQRSINQSETGIGDTKL